MVHLHLGAGRQGLALIAPAFQVPGSELMILSRAVSSANVTGSTTLSLLAAMICYETIPTRPTSSRGLATQLPATKRRGSRLLLN
jgi:hypothetical protein